MNGGKTDERSPETAPGREVTQKVAAVETDTFQEDLLWRTKIKLKGKTGTDAVALFCRQLSALVDVGIPLLKCLQILHQRTTHLTLRTIIHHLSEDIEQGKSFSTALETFPKVFTPFFVNMAKVAEKGGSLDESLKVIADTLEKEQLMKEKIRDALWYPLITLLVSFLVVLVLIIFVIPKFGTLYEDSNLQLPWITKMFIWLGHPITLGVLAVIALALIGSFFWLGRSKSFSDRAMLRIPIFGALFVKIYVARFARNFGTLLQGGVPMLQALDVVKQTSENVVVEDAVDRAITHVEGGGRVEQPLREADVFPDVVVDMIAIGEEAGKLDMMLFKITELYEGDIERTISTLASSLHPILILILGILTGLIAWAMFTPYFNYAQSIGGL